MNMKRVYDMITRWDKQRFTPIDSLESPADKLVFGMWEKNREPEGNPQGHSHPFMYGAFQFWTKRNRAICQLAGNSIS